MIDRVVRGQTLTITRSGKPVAELHPLAPPRLLASALVERWCKLPVVDPQALCDDVAHVFDPALGDTAPPTRDGARHEHHYPSAVTRRPGVLPAEPLITAMTLAELTVGPLAALTDDE